MPFVSMSGLLTEARAGGYAVPAFCFWNAEALDRILRVAAELKAPVIVMNGPAEYQLLQPRELGAIAHALIGFHDVKTAPASRSRQVTSGRRRLSRRRVQLGHAGLLDLSPR